MIIKESEYRPKIGDIVIVWGDSRTSRFIAFLERRLFGFKDPATHVEMVALGEYDISADAGGVMLVKRKGTIDTARKVVIVRHSHMTSELRKLLLTNVFHRFIGKSYDYSLYVLWLMRICFITNPIVFWALYPFRDLLKKYEHISYSCSELVSAISFMVDILTGYGNDRDVAPPHFNVHAIASPEVWSTVFRKEEKKRNLLKVVFLTRLRRKEKRKFKGLKIIEVHR